MRAPKSVEGTELKMLPMVHLRRNGSLFRDRPSKRDEARLLFGELKLYPFHFQFDSHCMRLERIMSAMKPLIDVRLCALSDLDTLR